MNVVILHDALPPDARPDELDVLVQVDAVERALHKLGHRCTTIPFGLNLEQVTDRLREQAPKLVFNLVESAGGSGRLIHLSPSLLENLRIPYTGARVEPMFLTSNKVLAKQFLAAHDIDTPAWLAADPNGVAGGPGSLNLGARLGQRASHTLLSAEQTGAGNRSPKSGGLGPPDGWGVAPASRRCASATGGRRYGTLASAYIIKSVWEEASLGLDDDAVVRPGSFEQLAREVGDRAERLGGEAFAEAFVDGREFNLAVLAGPDGPEVLPPAEIRFVDYPPDRPRIVGYKAKWHEDSHEYRNTPRTFDFPAADATLVETLGRVTRQCWDLFGLTGYARVDFRVDGDGRPWVLEVNANPCLSPDAGFMAAANRHGLDMADVVRRLLAAALR